LNLGTFDLVVCNLYPFMENPSIETIDIGGVTLLRAAGKNYQNVVVLSTPKQYDNFIKNNNTSSDPDNILGTNECDRKGYAKAAFSFISDYDNNISKYMSNKSNIELNKLGDLCLKYGMNPHQTGKVSFEDPLNPPFKLINGTLGMINIYDIINGWLTVKEVDSILKLPAAISMKHTSLAGLAVGNEITDIVLNYYNLSSIDMNVTPVSMAYMKSRIGDPLSSFGDFICISREVDLATAMLIKTEVTDGIAAPSYTPEALEILKTKKSGEFKIVLMSESYYKSIISKGWDEIKRIYGVILSQKNNNHINEFKDIKDVNTRIDYVLAHTALKYAQSNNISMAVNGQIIGMGCGQQNRVGCVKLAGDKAINWALRNNNNAMVRWNSYRSSGLKRQEKVNRLYQELDVNNHDLSRYPVVLASDGFFPFTDNIEQAHKYGVKHIIHPGGSVKDREIQVKCDELNIKLIVTGSRMFYH